MSQDVLLENKHLYIHFINNDDFVEVFLILSLLSLYNYAP